MRWTRMLLCLAALSTSAAGHCTERQDGGAGAVYNYRCTIRYMTQNGFDPFPQFHPRTANVSGWSLERTVANGCVIYLMRTPKMIGDYIDSVHCVNLTDPRASIRIDYQAVKSEFWSVLDGLVATHRGPGGDRDLAAGLERLRAVGNPEVCVPGTPLY